MSTKTFWYLTAKSSVIILILYTAVCALYSLTAPSSTWGYVRCQDLKRSFDSPDQLLMVIRAPPETQMQVSEPSKVWAPKCSKVLRLMSTIVTFSPACPPPFRVLRCPWRARKALSTSSSVQKTARVPVAPLAGAALLKLTPSPPWPPQLHSPLTNQKPADQQPPYRRVHRRQHPPHLRWRRPLSRRPHHWW